MEFLINVFAAIGVAITALVLVTAAGNAIDNFKSWRRKRKNDRSINCNSCGRLYPSDACRTCRRNPNFMDNWLRNRLEENDD